MKSEVSPWKIAKAREIVAERVSDARCVETTFSRPEVAACIRAFDGRVVNKRFFDAMAVATGEPPSDDDFGHRFGKLFPRRGMSGPFNGIDVRTTRGKVAYGIQIDYGAHGRLDADKTLDLLTNRIAEARKVAETDWNAQIDRLVAELNEIGKRIDVLKGAFDEQLWYDLEMQRLLLFY